MPRYFFHLSFGQRTVPDEEGVELSNRIAARDEALAVVRDLANPEHRGNPRRWASWFLEVADETGRFFRTPIGHPALELVTPETNARRLEQPDAQPLRPTPIAPLSHLRDGGDRSASGHAPGNDGAAAERQSAAATRAGLQCRASEGIRTRTDRLISLARAADARY